MTRASNIEKLMGNINEKRKLETHHDIPKEVKKFFTVASNALQLDSYDLYVLGSQFGGNWQKLIDELLEWAYANIHTNSEIHSVVAKAADIVYAKMKFK